MKLKCNAESDTIHIDLLDRAVVDSDDVRPGVILAMDSGRNPLRIEIRHASKNADPSSLSLAVTPPCAMKPQTAQAIEPDLRHIALVDAEAFAFVEQIARRRHTDISTVVNELIKNDRRIAEYVHEA